MSKNINKIARGERNTIFFVLFHEKMCQNFVKIIYRGILASNVSITIDLKPLPLER